MASRNRNVAVARAETSLGSAKSTAPCGSCPIRQLVGAELGSGEMLQGLAAIATQLRFSPRQHILSEGDLAKHWFLVADGMVAVWKWLHDGRRQVTGFLARGDLLGIRDNGRYIYNAHATNDVRICRFSWQEFDPLIERFPTLQRSLLSRARHELTAAQDQMLLLGRMTAEERIASFLLNITNRMGEGERPAERLPMTRLEIADYLGLTQETLCRILSGWRRNRIIELSRDQSLHIRDRKRLAQLAEQAFD